MEKQERNLKNLFQQLGDKSEKIQMPDLKLKDAVFSTVDAATLIADMVDLFTFKFLQTQGEVLDALPESTYGNEKQNLLRYFEKKYAEKKADDEG